MKSKITQVGLGIACSAIALYLALRGVDWDAVRAAATNANYGLILLAAALNLTIPLLRAVRWRLLLYPIRDVRLWHLYGSLNVGYAMNNVLPLQMGELGRVYLLSELASISVARSLSSIIVERVLDVLALLLFLLIITPVVDVPGWVEAPSIVLAVVSVTALLGLIAVSLRRGLVSRLLAWLLRLAPPRLRPKLGSMAENALDGLGVLTNARLDVQLLVSTAVTWLVTGLVLFIGFEAFDIDAGYGAALFLMIATAFGFFVPASPGSFGVYHAIVIGALTSVFEIDRALAVSYALVIHLVLYIEPIVVAMIFLWIERRVWRRLTLFHKIRELRSPIELTAAEAPPAPRV